LLVESGFRAASTNAIARRAGVSVGSLYQYFASREDVFHALVDQHREAMHALVGEALEAIEAGAAPAPTLSALLERMIAIHRTAPDLMHAMQTQLNHLETEAERQREAAAMETMVVRMARLLPVPEPEARARIWLAAEMLATLARRLGHRPPDCASLPAIQAVLAEQLGHLLPPGQGRSTTLAHASHRF
jgi:AcrR family transcriptional regulator